jgi:hypothetical protein
VRVFTLLSPVEVSYSCCLSGRFAAVAGGDYQVRVFTLPLSGCALLFVLFVGKICSSGRRRLAWDFFRTRFSKGLMMLYWVKEVFKLKQTIS